MLGLAPAPSDTGFDATRSQAFAGRMLELQNAGALAPMTSLGHRSGLFDAMAGLPPATSREIARAARLDERHVREWLGAMATDGIVLHQPEADTYVLPSEHAASLTCAAGPRRPRWPSSTTRSATCSAAASARWAYARTRGRRASSGCRPSASPEEDLDLRAVARETTPMNAMRTTPAMDLAPEPARFQLLDAVASPLFDSARDRPQLLALEDLHVSAAFSLQRLEFVAAQARAHSICLLATCRESEADRAGAGTALSRAGRETRSPFLSRLARDELALYREQVTAVGSDAATVDAIHSTTEGNPLLPVDTTRLLLSRGFETLGRGGRRLVSRSVGNASRERLASLSRGTRELLEPASVGGRDFSRARLGAISGADVADLAASLIEALDAALVDETPPAPYRFSHILIREVLYMELQPARRVERCVRTGIHCSYEPH